MMYIHRALLTAAAVPAPHDGLHDHQGEGVLVGPGRALEGKREVRVGLFGADDSLVSSRENGGVRLSRVNFRDKNIQHTRCTADRREVGFVGGGASRRWATATTNQSKQATDQANNSVVAASVGAVQNTVGRSLTLAMHRAQSSGGSLCGCWMDVLSTNRFHLRDCNA